MQKILSRRVLTLLSRSTPLVPLLSTNLFSLTHRASFPYSQETDKGSKFDSVPSFDGIISSISNSENCNQILETFAKAGKHYRNEQIVLSLRMLGRHIRTRGDQFAKDERFVKLQQKMAENIDSYSDHELLDLLFWLRKFRMYKIPLSLNEKDIGRIYFRINDFVKSKNYSCRNLINVYFDYCHMNQPSDPVAFEILNDIRQDSKILTTFSCIQIVQAISYKSFMTMKDSQLLNQIIRVIPNFEQDFDIEQKSTIFKHLSKMELNYSPPRFQVPNVIYRLKDQLKEKIEQLGEMAVNNIIEAYESLPKEFPVDLLEEIKEMMCVTIQHNPKVISSNFLLGIYESFANLKTRKRKIAEQKLAILEKELLQRIKEGDADLTRMKSLDTMLEICGKAKNEEVMKALHEAYIKAKTNDPKYQGYFGIEFLARNNMDVRTLIDMELSRDPETTRPSSLVYLLNVLSFLKDEKYASQLTALQAKVNSMILTDPLNVLRSLINTELRSNLRNDLLPQLLPHIQRLFQEKSINTRYFFKLAFESCFNRNIREEWFKFLQTLFTNGKEDLKPVMIEGLGSVEYPENEAISLLFNVFTIAKPNSVDMKKLMFAFKENQRLLVTVEKNDFLMQRLGKHLLDVTKEEPEKVRISSVYQLILKINNIRPRNSVLYPALETLLINPVAFDTFTQMQASIFLLNKRSLSPRAAESVCKKIDQLKNLQDQATKIKLYNQSINQSQEFTETQLDTLHKNYNMVKENLNNPNPRMVLSNLASILAFPPEIIKDDGEFIKKTLGDFIQQGNTNSYLGLLKSFNPKTVSKNRMLYIPMVREVSNNFNHFSVRMPFPDILDSLEMFSRLGVKNPAIYNQIIENIGKNFNMARVEDLVSILRDFSFVGMKQVDLFDKIVQRVLEKSASTVRVFFNDIMNALYQIGFDSEFIKKEFQNILTTIGVLNSNQFRVFAAALNYIPVLDIKDEHILIESLTNKLIVNVKNPEIKANIGALNSPSFYFTVMYLKNALKEKPELVNALEAALTEKDKDFMENLKKTGKKFFEVVPRKKAIETVENYLQVMKIPYEKDFVLSGMPIDIYIPSQKQVIKVFSMRDTNFDRKSLKGNSIVITKIYKSFSDYTAICVSLTEMLSNADHLSKVKYLQELGIKSPVNENEFDFSLIKTPEKPQRKQRETTHEEIIEEEAVEEHEEDKHEKVKDVIPDEVEEKVVKK